MIKIDTLIHARWLVPLSDDAPSGGAQPGILEHYSLAVKDGIIAAIVPSTQARQDYQADRVYELADHVLMPGLINAHTHAAMTLMRGMADDLPLMTWLNEHIWPAEARWVSADYVRAGTDLALVEMLRGGTTCFNDMYFFPRAIVESVQTAGIRAAIGLIAIDFPSAYAQNIDEYLDQGIALLQEQREQNLLHFVLAPHAPYTVAGENLQRIQALAEQYDLPIHMHVHETATEVEQWQQQHGKRPIQHLAELGLLNPRLLAVHMTQLTEAEIEQVAMAGVHVLHCPESNLKLASGFCPVAKLQSAGINIAIGTDGVASNNDLDMFGELCTAAQLAKAVAQDAAVVPAYTVLKMATINGARALGIDKITGSLQPGKAADMIAVDLSWPETQPVFHPLSQLVYALNRYQVSDVWVAGKQLLDNRQLTTLDAEAITAQAKAWAQKLQS